MENTQYKVAVKTEPEFSAGTLCGIFLFLANHVMRFTPKILKMRNGQRNFLCEKNQMETEQNH
jgi:hypothetical protein